MQYVDANVVLRYILWDNEELAKKAEEIIENQEIIIPFEVIAEIVYVLERVYEVKRDKIKDNVTGLFEYPDIYTSDIEVLREAFELYCEKKLDFIDTILIGYNKVRGIKVHTFDNKMNKYLIS